MILCCSCDFDFSVGLRAIPIVYKPCRLPGFLKPIHCLDYSTKHQSLSEEQILKQFWQKLIQLMAATAEQALASMLY